MMRRCFTDNPVDEQAIDVLELEQPVKSNHARFFTVAFWFQHLSHIVNLAAIRLRIPGGGLVAPLGNLWARYYPRVAFGEEGVIMPRSSLAFIINTLLIFADIKSQGLPGFPFQTHPRTIRICITSLLMYGLTSAAELGVSGFGLDQTSAYAIIARLGRIGSLCMLVTSLAFLFYC